MPHHVFARSLAVVLLTTLTQLPTHAQSVEYGYSRTIRIAAPAFKPMDDVDGTPYLPGDSTERGWLVLGVKRIPVHLHYNTYTGEVEYKSNNQLLAAPDAVSGFTIVTPDTLQFKRGFPAIETWTTNSFYQVLYDGRRAKLVKHISTSIKAGTDAMANDYGKKQFRKREEYYIWQAIEQPPLQNYAEKLSNGVMKSVVVSKKMLTDIFSSEASLIDHYVVSNKMKIKSWNDVIAVLKYIDAH